MKLDRDLQKRILEGLSLAYPDCLHGRTYLIGDVDSSILKANLAYLFEHGLVETILSAHDQRMMGPRLDFAKITAKGLDFLEQDGGLSAILGTVTVKLHADTIREMLKTRIMSSQLLPEDKKRFVDTLKELPGEALKTVTNKLVEKGLEALSNPQSIVSLLQGVIN